MKVTVIVKPGSKIEKIEALATGELVIRVSAPPIEGRANERVIEILADYFDTAKSNIELVSGQKSKKKIFKISS